MTQLPQESFELVNQVFDVIGLSEEEKAEYRDKFEKLLLARFAAAVIKKLPQSEAKTVADLANSVQTDEQRQALQAKLSQWLNPQETKNLLQKVSDEVFAEFVKTVYDTAHDNQKKKLETIFKPEALKG